MRYDSIKSYRKVIKLVYHMLNNSFLESINSSIVCGGDGNDGGQGSDVDGVDDGDAGGVIMVATTMMKIILKNYLSTKRWFVVVYENPCLCLEPLPPEDRKYIIVVLSKETTPLNVYM